MSLNENKLIITPSDTRVDGKTGDMPDFWVTDKNWNTYFERVQPTKPDTSQKLRV